VPLLDGFQARNRLSQAKIALKEAEFIAENTRIQLRQNIERDYLNMTATLNRYQALIDQVSSYAENFRAAEVRFNNGASNSVDYLIAKNKLDNSNIDLIIARYDFLLRTRILDYYQGKLSW
jgi:outer membrane protein